MTDDHTPRRPSKFEWRPEDVEVLSDVDAADAAAALAAYEAWRVAQGEPPTRQP